MMSRSLNAEIRCPACDTSQWCGLPEMVQRLRQAGMLKRSDDADPVLIWELLLAVADRLTCPECGHVGLSVTEDDFDAAWETARMCDSCGRPIPPERLEALPKTMLCAACQTADEQGGRRDEAEYCPRCGTPMELRQQARGVTRYVMRCPRCR